ncbi:hypothetical protein Ddye_000469 [Dipteronia dyeriana]|uniref:Transmembrane protein n=1 Tax=Dipteronia dyeriana TaxID=168575 RepID=A0AAD9XMD3_9ROSI|nr:hypothetical protein Ddye_000469 [Dipteronia dyeriana]
MADKIFALSFLVVLLLQNNFEMISASRSLGVFHPPAIPRSGLSMNRPKPPSVHYYTINRYKKTETEAFRPTSPGHSPGVGHNEPPATPRS